MATRIARGGSPIILITLAITILVFFASLLSPGNWDAVLKIPFWTMFFFSLFTLFFLRDPERKAPPDPAVMYAPADGTIIDIRTIEEPLYLKSRVIRISIFMSVFNVHVNRSPVNGTVELMQYALSFGNHKVLNIVEFYLKYSVDGCQFGSRRTFSNFPKFGSTFAWN